ncbi:hypothetical protein TWF694_004531 [Orbilia ellipsospora]|uniref:Clr5 domain-containing protein n=1 Tax=Orbilia ellipsospora TaxID=2528407 RepID=A0AAV9WVE4_9PEZI
MDPGNTPGLGAAPKKATAPKIDDSTWEQYKEYIRFLYIDEKNTLEQVRERIKNELGFEATKAQYIRMVNQVWKLPKTLKRKDAQFIEAECNKRSRQEKLTEIRYGGRLVEEDEIRRKASRHYVTVLEQHQQRLLEVGSEANIAGEIPNDIELRTPPEAIESHSASSPNFGSLMEWLHSPYDPSVREQSLSPVPSLCSGRLTPSTFEWLQPFLFQNPLLHIMPTMQFEYIFESEIKFLFKEPRSYLFNAKDNNALAQILSPKPVENTTEWVSKVVSGALGQNKNLQDLLSFFKSYMVRLSNNIDDRSIQRKCLDGLLQSGQIAKHKYILESILKQGSSIDSSDHSNSSSILEAPDYTKSFRQVVRNFAIELFYSASRIGDLDMVKYLIGVGILGSNRTKTPQFHTLTATAVQFSIQYRQEAVWRFLLRQGININTEPLSELPSLLCTAVLVDIPHLVAELVQLGAKDPIQNSSISNTNLWGYINGLKDDNLAWTKNLYIRPTTDIITALQLSVAAKRDECFRILAKEHARRPKSFSSRHGRKGLLHIATELRNHKVMEEIIEWQGLRIKIDGKIEILTRRHVEESSLYIAISNEDVTAMKILCKHGAKIDNISPNNLEKLDPQLWLTNVTQANPSLKNSSAQPDIRQILEYMEYLASQSKAELSDTLFSESEFDSDDDNDISWSTRFPRLQEGWIANVTNLVKRLLVNDPNYNLRIIATCLEISAIFLDYVTVGVGPDYDTAPQDFICTNISGRLHKFTYDETERFLKEFREFLPDYLLEALIIPDSTWIYFHPDAQRRTTRNIENVLQIVREHGRYQRPTPYETFIKKLNKFCFDMNGKKEEYFDIKNDYNNGKGMKLLSKLEQSFEKNKDDMGSILEWSSRIPDDTFRRRLCNFAVRHILALQPDQLLSLLKAAAHNDLHDVVERVINHENCPQITKEVVSVATWFASIKSFDLILEKYNRNSSEESLEIPLLQSIFVGQVYKTVKLIERSDINYDFGMNRTALETTAILGRLDIAKVLLESGASKSLHSAQRQAFRRGHFALSDMISEAIAVKRARNENINV